MSRPSHLVQEIVQDKGKKLKETYEQDHPRVRDLGLQAHGLKGTEKYINTQWPRHRLHHIAQEIVHERDFRHTDSTLNCQVRLARRGAKQLWPQRELPRSQGIPRPLLVSLFSFLTANTIDAKNLQ